MTATTTAAVLGSVRAMACDVTIHGSPTPGVAETDVAGALSRFTDVDRACTRFNLESPLMRVNARPDRWHEVPETLLHAVQEAHAAYQRTHGWFDPRVLRTLVGLGYDRSLPFEAGGVATSAVAVPSSARGPWRPRFRGGPGPQVHLGGEPIDLGGIGKGLALRWASERLEQVVDDYLIDAGGDCVCRGRGPDGDGWRVGVEDPRGGTHPLVVVELRDVACTTSSIRLRRWRCGGRSVHHLVDPRTGRPGGDGLLAVTVIGADAAAAEVLSKTLFLRGRRAIAAEASRLGVAAFWVGSDGRTGETKRFGTRVIWRAQ
jgi:thiamine biosynthesis lipoprotein